MMTFLAPTLPATECCCVCTARSHSYAIYDRDIGAPQLPADTTLGYTVSDYRDSDTSVGEDVGTPTDSRLLCAAMAITLRAYTLVTPTGSDQVWGKCNKPALYGLYMAFNKPHYL